MFNPGHHKAISQRSRFSLKARGEHPYYILAHVWDIRNMILFFHSPSSCGAEAYRVHSVSLNTAESPNLERKISLLGLLRLLELTIQTQQSCQPLKVYSPNTKSPLMICLESFIVSRTASVKPAYASFKPVLSPSSQHTPVNLWSLFFDSLNS